MTDINLPIPQSEFLSSLGVAVPPPIMLEHDSTLSEVQKADIALFNTSLKVLYALWGEVKTANAALTLINQTMTLIEKRRDIMGLDYGAANNKGGRTLTYDPLA